MARLFSQIVQDITKEIEPQLVGLDAISQRGRAEKLARDQVFKKLLPQACKYAARRLVYVSDQTNSIMRVREHLSQEKPKEVTLERSRSHAASNGDMLRRQTRSYTTSVPSQVEDFRAVEKKEGGTELCAQTFALMKGEVLLGQMLEPEVLRFVAETSPVFHTIYRAYAHIPTASGEGHMSLMALVRFCADFCLFPNKVDFQTLQWLYSLETGQEAGAGLAAASSPTTQGPPAGKKMRKRPVKSEGGFIYLNKWLKGHLAWMSKDSLTMSDTETRSCYILVAMDDWMESHNLKVREVFGNLDPSNSGTFTVQDLELVLKFMDFEDMPTQDDIETLAGLLISKPGSGVIEFTTLETAMVAARRAKESRSRARNCFLKDLSKMSQAESNAFLFFGDMIANMEHRSIMPESFYRMMDVEDEGLVPGFVIVRQARLLERQKRNITPGMLVENPFQFIGKSPEDTISQEEFIDLIEEVREARRLREMNAENRHPLFISSSFVQPGTLPKTFFGPKSFVKTVMKMGLLHLTYHGNLVQASLPSFDKLLWLFVYLHWCFDSSRQKVSELLGRKSLGGFERPPSRQTAAPTRPNSSGRPTTSDANGRRYPKHLPPMRRLLARHPGIFMEAVQEVELPEWAMPENAADVLLEVAYSRFEKSHAHEEMFEGDSQIGSDPGMDREENCPPSASPLMLEHEILATVCDFPAWPQEQDDVRVEEVDPSSDAA